MRDRPLLHYRNHRDTHIVELNDEENEDVATRINAEARVMKWELEGRPARTV